jgi:hypothetical protein
LPIIQTKNYFSFIKLQKKSIIWMFVGLNSRTKYHQSHYWLFSHIFWNFPFCFGFWKSLKLDSILNSWISITLLAIVIYFYYSNFSKIMQPGFFFLCKPKPQNWHSCRFYLKRSSSEQNCDRNLIQKLNIRWFESQ